VYRSNTQQVIIRAAEIVTSALVRPKALLTGTNTQIPHYKEGQLELDRTLGGGAVGASLDLGITNYLTNYLPIYLINYLTI